MQPFWFWVSDSSGQLGNEVEVTLYEDIYCGGNPVEYSQSYQGRFQATMDYDSGDPGWWLKASHIVRSVRSRPPRRRPRSSSHAPSPTPRLRYCSLSCGNACKHWSYKTLEGLRREPLPPLGHAHLLTTYLRMIGTGLATPRCPKRPAASCHRRVQRAACGQSGRRVQRGRAS